MVISLRPLSKKQTRINERVFDYWEELRGDRDFPNENEIDPDALKEIWGSCFLVTLAPDENPRYKYSYLGQNLIEAFGDEQGDKEVCEMLVYPVNEPLMAKFAEIEETGKPAREENEFTNKRGANIKYRSVMLPLANADGKVGFILGGMKWKSY